MKKIIKNFGFILLLSVIVSTFVSCNKAGKYGDGDVEVLLHGKKYKFMQICPKEGANVIWIMYPADSATEIPAVVEYKQGKHYSQTIIIK